MKNLKKILSIFIILMMLTSMSFAAIDNEPATIVSGNGVGAESALYFIEYIEPQDIPINPAFARQNLDGINVSDLTLQEFSRFFIWLEKQGFDAEAEGVNLIYIDDDLQTIPNAWVFTTSDYRPILEESKISNKIEGEAQNETIISRVWLMVSKSAQNERKQQFEMVAQDEIVKDGMISYLSDFEQKYPVRNVQAGYVTFITVENKGVLLSSVSEEDIQMLNTISDAVIDEAFSERDSIITSNWGSSNPDVHAEMSKYAAQRAGFNSTFVNIISTNASKPDKVSLALIIGFNNIPLYAHYYNPLTGFGGAKDSMNKCISKMLNTSVTTEKAEYLSYASHFVCDLSMPLHTSMANEQAIEYLHSKPHLDYESYVGQNWANGEKFGYYSQVESAQYANYNPDTYSVSLATSSNQYGATLWDCALNNNYNNTLKLITIYCIVDGQIHLNSLMQYGKNKI